MLNHAFLHLAIPVYVHSVGGFMFCDPCLRPSCWRIQFLRFLFTPIVLEDYLLQSLFTLIVLADQQITIRIYALNEQLHGQEDFVSQDET